MLLLLAEIDSERRFSYSQLDSNKKKDSDIPPRTSRPSIKSLLGPSVPIADQIKSHKAKNASLSRRETHQDDYVHQEEIASVSGPSRRSRILPPKPSVSTEKRDGYDSKKESRGSFAFGSGRSDKTKKAEQVASSEKSDDEYERKSRASSIDSVAGLHQKLFKEREKSKSSVTSTRRKFSEETDSKKLPPVSITEYSKPGTKEQSIIVSANYAADSVIPSSSKFIKKENRSGYTSASVAESRESGAEKTSRLSSAAGSHRVSKVKAGSVYSAASVTESDASGGERSSRIPSASESHEICREKDNAKYSVASVAESRESGAEKTSRLSSAAGSHRVSKVKAGSVYSAASVTESDASGAERSSRIPSASESHEICREKDNAKYSVASVAESRESGAEKTSRLSSAAGSHRVSKVKAGSVYSAASVTESDASGGERSSRIPSTSKSRRVGREKGTRASVYSAAFIAEPHKSTIRKDSRASATVVGTKKSGRVSSSATMTAKGRKLSSVSSLNKYGKPSTDKSSRINSAGSVVESGKKKGKGKRKQIKKKKSPAGSSSEKSEDDFPTKESRESSLASSVDEHNKIYQEEILQEDDFFDSENENKAEKLEYITKLSDRESISATIKSKTSDHLYVNEKVTSDRLFFDPHYQDKPAAENCESKFASDRESISPLDVVDDVGKEHNDQKTIFEDDSKTDFLAHETNLLASEIVDHDLINASNDTIADAAPEQAAYDDLDEDIEISLPRNVSKDNAQFFNNNQKVKAVNNDGEEKIPEAIPAHDYAFEKLLPADNSEDLIPQCLFTNKLDEGSHDALDNNNTQGDIPQAMKEQIDRDAEDEEFIENLDKIPSAIEDQESTPLNDVSTIFNLEQVVPDAEISQDFAKMEPTADQDNSIGNDENNGEKRAWQFDNVNTDDPATNNFNEEIGTKNVSAAEDTDKDDDKNSLNKEILGDDANDVSGVETFNDETEQFSDENFGDVSERDASPEKFDDGFKEPSNSNYDDFKESSAKNFDDIDIDAKGVSVIKNADDDTEKHFADNIDDDGIEASADEKAKNGITEPSRGYFLYAKESFTSNVDVKEPPVDYIDLDDNISKSSVSNFDETYKEASASNFDYDDAKELLAQNFDDNDAKELSAYNFDEIKKTPSNLDDFKDKIFEKNDNEANNIPDTNIFDEEPKDGAVTKPDNLNNGMKNTSAFDVSDDTDEDEIFTSFH